ncbi:Long-chain-fatty-acid--CoA ligase FadD13 [Sinobacterium norvegicum]|uniref:Long-chain-fatty-acid--CoA ligase FadD13 n=1 Tax=Sinobacterium norvegicum TaxID=1641715 RepID=A0ABN8ED30_9GAMM|nr:class I adenylate-forming enzyme family protein [Sinobacterium norvegicum]CAH0990166.1 Long-chain-fatty-acid--CoA ligase FadD13 [Sinobacterium norvegicum]
MTEQLRQAIDTLTLEGMPFAIDTCEKTGEKTYLAQPESLRAIYEAAKDHGDACYMAYDDEQWTFSQTLERAAKLGHYLADNGIGQGDRVAIAMRNYPEWMTSFIAITAIGGVAVALNSWGSGEELNYGVKDSQSKAIIGDSDRLDRLTELEALTDILAICCRSEVNASYVQWQDIMQQRNETEFPAQTIADDSAPALIMYTSGTTGQPKGAVSSNKAVLSGLMNVEMSGAIVAMQHPEVLEKIMNNPHQSGALLTVPLFHVSGLHACTLPALRRGSKVVMMYKWDAKEALKLIDEHNLQSVSGAPMVVENFLDEAEAQNKSLDHLFSLASGGQAQPAHLTQKVKDRVPNGMIGAGYGMTEANSTICSVAGNTYLCNPTSCGYSLPIVDLELRDDNGEVVGDGERGEIFVRGPMLMTEYYGRPEATQKVLVDGWYASGDIGQFCDKGLLHIVDRKKDMIIRGGENIYCAEVEAVLLAHDEILECCSFGLPHDTWGEELAMVVVAKPGSDLSAEGVQMYIKQHLANYKVPTKVYFSEQALPRNTLNKILKPAVKAQYQ